MEFSDLNHVQITVILRHPTNTGLDVCFQAVRTLENFHFDDDTDSSLFPSYVIKKRGPSYVCKRPKFSEPRETS